MKEREREAKGGGRGEWTGQDGVFMGVAVEEKWWIYSVIQRYKRGKASSLAAIHALVAVVLL